MRCDCCPRILNDFEATLKTTDGEYTNTCRKCLKGLGIKTIGRTDLNPDEEINDDWFDVGSMVPTPDSPYFDED